MALSRKYGRTYHYPFSPGTTNDDRICADYWSAVESMDRVVHTEKLDGENTCLNQYGVFARSHAAPTRHPWAGYLKERWQWLRRDLGELELFGENLYAIHSIAYPRLEEHFFVFAVRVRDQWLSWEEVEFYAALVDLPTVPVVGTTDTAQYHRADYEHYVLDLIQAPSRFGSVDVHTGQPCSCEGIVSRNVAAFAVNDMHRQVFKYVRAGHVKTDKHWTRNWRRAPLINEQPKHHVDANR